LAHEVPGFKVRLNEGILIKGVDHHVRPLIFSVKFICIIDIEINTPRPSKKRKNVGKKEKTEKKT
jgi:hypothetical protein